MNRRDFSKALAMTIVAFAAIQNASYAASGVELPSPWAWWRGDSLSGSTLTDRSCNGNVASMADVEPGPDVGAWNNEVSAQIGPYIHFYGWGGSGMSAPQPEFGSKTLAMWINRKNQDSVYSESRVSEPVTLVRNFNGFDVASGYGERVLRLYAGGSAVNGASFGLLRASWHLLVFTVDDSGEVDSNGRHLCDWKAYLDGEVAASADSVALTDSNAENAFFFNRGFNQTSGTPAYWHETRIWNAALSAAQVKFLYDTTRPANRLAGRWPLDTIETDGSGNNVSPEATGSGAPMRIGTLCNIVDGIEGSGALFFGAPYSDVAAGVTYNESYAEIANSFRLATEGENVTFCMWMRRAHDCGNPNGAFPCYLFHTPEGYVRTENGRSWGALGANSSIRENFAEPHWNQYNGNDLEGAICRSGEWCHLAVAVKFKADGDGTVRCRTVAYRNGMLAATSPWSTDSVDASSIFTTLLTSGTTTTLGNSPDRTHFFRGEIDDFRIYTGNMSSNDIRRIYQGAAVASAGTDFTVNGNSATLRGTLLATGSSKLGEGAAGDVEWTFVSSSCGATPVIASPASLETPVTLPSEGSYVFRLTSSNGFSETTDDVTVVRADNATAASFSLAASLASATGLCAVVKATGAPSGARLAWDCVSGPGCVFFADGTAASAFAEFTTAGAYILRCTAEKDGRTATASVTVDVSGDASQTLLGQSLVAYWPIGYDTSFNDYVLDSLRGLKLYAGEGNATVSFKKWLFVPGASGTYGINIPDSTQGNLQSELPMSEGNGTLNDPPPEQWFTFSGWIYHDGSQTTDTSGSAILSTGGAMGLVYHHDNGAGNDIEMVQYAGYTEHRLRFSGPDDVNFTNRWVHVVAQFDQHGQGGSEVWVNGRKLAVKSGDGLGAGRFISGRIVCFGGTTEPWLPLTLGSETDFAGRFPGFMDEIRVYRRKLSEAEIRCLCEHPVPGLHLRAPAVRVPETVSAIAHSAKTIQAAAAKDPAADGTLAIKWEVVSGDETKLAFSDLDSAITTVTALAAGEYVLRLMATDGTRTTYSRPVSLTCLDGGTMLLFR